MIVVNNQKDLVYPLPLFGKKKKLKSQTMSPTLPKSQGPKASDSLPQKRKIPLSKKTPKKTKATPPPKTTEGSKNNPLIRDYLPRLLMKAWLKLRPEGLLGDNDSGGNKTPFNMEPINPIVADPLGTGAKYQEKHEEAAFHYANLKASINEYYDENIAHRDQTDKLVEAPISSLEKSITATSDLYKGLKIINELLKEINNAVKDDLAMKKKIKPITIINPEPISHKEKAKVLLLMSRMRLKKLVKASSTIRPDLDAPILIPYMINGKLFYLTKEQIQAHMDKEDQIKKAEEEARLFVINKPEVIKVVREEAKK
ncbi:hypothetical protein Tco_1051370 [Tanacetum coccineum]